MKSRLTRMVASLKKAFTAPRRPASSTLSRRAHLTVEFLEERQMMATGMKIVSPVQRPAVTPSASLQRRADPVPDIAIDDADFCEKKNTSRMAFSYRTWADGTNLRGIQMQTSFDVGLYWSAKPTFDGSATLLKMQSFSKCTNLYWDSFYDEYHECFSRAREIFQLSAQLTADPSRPYLLVVADPYNKIKETNENNNVRSFILPTITLKVLNHVEYAPNKYTAKPGETLTFQAACTPSIQEIGDFNVLLWRTTPSYSNVSLKGTQNDRTWTCTWTPTEAGNYCFRLCIHSTWNAVCEPPIFKIEVQKPDIQMKDARFNFNLSGNKRRQIAGIPYISAVSFQYTTRADGAVPNSSRPMSETHEVGLYRSDRPVFDWNAVRIGSTTVKGTDTSAQFNLPTSLRFDPGRPWVLIVADPDNRVQETNENNNVACLCFNKALERIMSGEGNCHAGAYLLAFGQLPDKLDDPSANHMSLSTLEAELKRKTGGTLYATIDPQGKKVASNLPAQGVFVALIGNDHAVYVNNGVAIDFVIGTGFGAHFGKGALSPLDEVRWKYNPDAVKPEAQWPWLYETVKIYKLS